MIRFALKGILGRKLRTALTAHRDRARRRHGERHVRAHRLDRQGVRHDLHGGLPRHGRHDHAASPRSTSRTGSGSTEAPFDESLLARGQGAARGRGRDRRRRERERAARQGRQGDRLRRRAEPRLLASTRRSPSSTPSRSSRAAGRGSDEVVIDAVDREQEGPRGRRLDRRAGRRARSRRSGSPGSSSSARSARSAARRSPASTCRPRRGSSARRASSTRSGVAREAGRRAPAARLARSGRSCRPGPRCAPATRRRREDAEEHGRVHLVPAVLPARVRRRSRCSSARS